MPATFTISRRNLSIALTVTLPAAAVCVAAVGALPLHSSVDATDANYRAPIVAMVQPRAGGAIPQDRPVVVFRFAAGESDDPLDAASFSVSLDGEDRTSGFHVSATEAWGSLVGPLHEAGLGLGSHVVEAGICSLRGACTMTSTAIIVQRGVRRRVR
jgi:hypothetical protein